jgi:hypothetical protein
LKRLRVPSTVIENRWMKSIHNMFTSLNFPGSPGVPGGDIYICCKASPLRMNANVQYPRNVGSFRQHGSHCLWAQVGRGGSCVKQEVHISDWLFLTTGARTNQVDHEMMVDSIESSSGRPGFFRKRHGIAQVGFLIFLDRKLVSFDRSAKLH